MQSLAFDDSDCPSSHSVAGVKYRAENRSNFENALERGILELLGLIFSHDRGDSCCLIDDYKQILFLYLRRRKLNGM